MINMTILKSVLLLALLSASLYSYSQEDKKDPVHISSGDLLAKGTNLYDSSRYEQAIDVLKLVERGDTNYVRALYSLSLCYYAQEQYAKSTEYCRKALQLNKDFEKVQPELLNQYGNSLDADGKAEEALAVYDSAIRRYPVYVLFYINKGNSLLTQKRYREAEVVLQQGLMINPYSYGIHFRLGLAAMHLGKTIPAMFCFTTSLLISPDSKYHSKCVDNLSAISKNVDYIRGYVDERKEEPNENFRLLEEIIQARIAVNVKYKPITRLDDPLCRQLQVLLEKLDYNAADNDFYMQYYVPYLKSVYSNGQFENFINYIFSDVNVSLIQEYNKKNKKQIDAFTQQATAYFSAIRSSRELAYAKRGSVSTEWFYSDEGLDSHGKYIESEKKTVGPWEFFYNAGNLKSKGLFDEQGKKDGPWIFYHPNGNIRAKEFYKHGLREGEQTYYFSNGVMSSRSTLKNDEAEGEAVSYFFSGAIKTIGRYHNGKEDGKKIGFTYTGDTSYIENYVQGVLQGESRTWSNGRRNLVEYFSNDTLNGPYRSYYGNGKLRAEGLYKSGRQEGDWKFYHANGRLKAVEHYVDDLSEGEYKEYDEEGVVVGSGTVKAGKLDGDARYFDHDGKPSSIYTYANGLIQEARFFDKNGQIAGSSRRDNGTLQLVQYSPEGVKKNSTPYNGQGNITGRQTFYYPSGRTMETDDYEDGQEQGYSTAYYANGEKKDQTNYKDGKKNGYHCSYYQHGQKKEEGWYTDDSPQDGWALFNELGKLTDSIRYAGGELDGFRSSWSPNGVKDEEQKFSSGWLEEWAQYDTTGREISRTFLKNASGPVKLIYPDGKTYMTATYKQGVFNGPRIFYYPDGKKMYECNYVMGSLDGPSIKYTPLGAVSEEGVYDHGDHTGIWKAYTIKGILVHSWEYIADVQEGRDTWYYENGKPETVTEYKHGERNGTYKSFDEDGALQYQLNYRNDRLISYSYLDKKDSLLAPIPFNAQSGKLKAFFSNGNLAAEIEYKDGMIDGPYKLYHSNGKTMLEKRRSYGTVEGPYKEYHANGQMTYSATYLHDNPHGVTRRYNEKGVLTEEWNYYLGQPHGTVRIFNDNGKIRATLTYYYGKLMSIKNETSN